ncbi:MAG: NADH-quinone oxidoreductase subunit NuoG [Anaerolineales bacterium]|nr:NADH-quinone oxidoreductase subunit NuoG [Anaerolineales bacterium]
MATIYIDGKAHEVDPKKNLLQVGLSLGYDIPYFCWHPAMGSVGACRQCAVKVFQDENDTRGRIVMACMTPAADGTRVSIHDEEAVEFRASVIEWLMINHPHDCPICDEGGECHLQDMTLMAGHTYRRHRFNKRTYHNQYLGPFINHEMNRCIQCYRCVRFYQDLAGGRDLDVFGAHDNVYFGRHADGVFESEFSGNLVEVCPTGVFTDKTLKQHYTRKWDLQTAPSVCVHCGVGCNTIPGERYNLLRRILNRYNREVNGYFICDRGRFGYEFVNQESRIYAPIINRGNGAQAEVVAPDEALAHMRELIANGKKTIGIGSPRASLEGNFSLRELVGAENFFAGVSQAEHQLINLALKILQDGPARSASLHDVSAADAVFVLGEDLTNTAPMVAFSVRQAVRNQPMEIPEKLGIDLWNDYAVREAVQDIKGPLVIATPTQSKLDDIATETFRGTPQDLARLGFAVANSIDPESPKVGGMQGSTLQLVENITRALKSAKRPLIVSGTSCGSEAILQAAANVAWALNRNGSPAELSFTVPEPNSLGLAMMAADSLQSAFDAIQNEADSTVIILENDLYRRSETKFVDDFLRAAKNIIVVDHTKNATTDRANVVLPAATFSEGDGTLVNNEGRAQRFFQVFIQEHGHVQESWRWMRDLMVALGQKPAEEWHNLDDIAQSLAAVLPIFKQVPHIAPPEGFRMVDQKIPRKAHRATGRTANQAHLSVHEPKPPADLDAPFNFSMEGFKGKVPGVLLPRYWAPGWNSVQALNKFQSEVGGPLHDGDPGKRLIEPSDNASIEFYQQIPKAYQPTKERWLIVPLYHVFGSEELSSLAAGIKELSPQPYITINSEDAAEMQIEAGTEVEIEIGATSLRLPVHLDPTLPQRVAGLPKGLAEMPNISLPAWGSLNLGSG